MKKKNFGLIFLGSLALCLIASFQNCSSFTASNLDLGSYSSSLSSVGNSNGGISTPTSTPPSAGQTSTSTPQPTQTSLPSPSSNETSSLPPAIAGQSYHLTFDDEFSTLKISNSYPAVYDGNNWYMGPWQALNCCLSTTTNTPAFQYSLQGDGNGTKDPSPFYQVSGGGLDIRMDYHPDLLYQGKGIIYTGDISTVDATGQGFSQMYGYWEIKAKFPSGLGVWPAIWMLPTKVIGTNEGWGEIDIQEGHSIANVPTNMSVTLHDWTNNTAPAWCDPEEPTTDDYHRYAMLWTEDTMTFYFDDKIVLKTPTPSVMKTPYYLILNLGLDSGWPAGVGITPFPQDMLIKYVRVYSKQNEFTEVIDQSK